MSRVVGGDGWDHVGLQDDLLGLTVGEDLLAGEGLHSVLGELLMDELLELLPDVCGVEVLVEEGENVGVQVGQGGHVAEVL